MSQRSSKQTLVSPLRQELHALRTQALAANSAEEESEVVVKKHFSGLTATEVAAASLGAEPGALRPIAFLNEAHFDILKTSNALSDSMVRRLEAYKAVASSDGF